MSAILNLRLAQDVLIRSLDAVQAMRSGTRSPTPPGWDSAVSALSNALAIVSSTLHAQVQGNPASFPGQDTLRTLAAQCRRLAFGMDEQLANRLLQLALDYEAEANAHDPLPAKNQRPN